MASLKAVAAGLLSMFVLVMVGTLVATVLLAGDDGAVTTGYLIANVAVSAVAAMAGGYVAAWLATHHRILHAAVLAALVVVMAIPGIGNPAPGQPSWYPPVLMVLGAICVLVGGVLGNRRGLTVVGRQAMS